MALYGNGPESSHRLRIRPLDDLLPGAGSQIPCLAHRLDDRSLPYAEAYVLAQLVRQLRPGRLFEIGTYTGAGSRILLQNAAPQAHLFTLDLPLAGDSMHLSGLSLDPPTDPGEVGREFRDAPIAGRITQLWGDSATFDFTPYWGSIDLVFVDGAHSYDYVKSDSAAAVRLLAPGGVIVWDDCARHFPGLVLALDEVAREVPISVIKGTRLAVHISAPHISAPEG